MSSSKFTTLALVAMTMAAAAANGAHVVNVVNKCGGATTVQIPGHGNYGAGSHSFDTDVRGGIAQPSNDINGQGSISVEFSLVNGVSSADITLIPPHKFNHPASFQLKDSTGHKVGATCNNAQCGASNAFFKYDDYQAQRQVTGPNASIDITFC